MKRDMDLIRDVLMAVEADPSPWAAFEQRTLMEERGPILEKYAPEEIMYHVRLMTEGGLITSNDHTHGGADHPIYGDLVMTWYGHDFLDAARCDTRWRKFKGIVAKAGGLTFDSMLKVLVKLGAESTLEQFDTPAGI